MHGTASVKVPDGKLVRAEVAYGDRLEDVTITGDFFLEPPAARERLEAAVEGAGTDVSRDELVARLEEVEAELVGFSREDVADAVLEVIQ